MRRWYQMVNQSVHQHTGLTAAELILVISLWGTAIFVAALYRYSA